MMHCNIIKTSAILLTWLFAFVPTTHCTTQVLGSCNFEGQDWLCNYQQPTSDNFNWTYHVNDGNHYMQVDTSMYQRGMKAQLRTPEIRLQDTHCFSFDVYIEHGGDSSQDNTSSSASGRLNAYVMDHDNRVLMQPVWTSNGINEGVWKTVHLALNPRLYQVVFEAEILRAIPGLIAIDNVVVSTVACESAPHFLRLGDKEINTGQNQTLQCLLWGHSGPNTHVVLQKSSGETMLPSLKQEYDDHLSAVFKFLHVSLSNGGMYRCVSANETQVGVSNYAELTVKVPPVPSRSPKVSKPGATNFMIQLNADEYSGNGPIVRTILNYRPHDGTWSDVHHISTSEYHLWNLQPDTVYELAVTLVRPGAGGTGVPGPTLTKKTKCGLPKSSVKNVEFVRSPDSSSITVQWDAPDFSITQCHFYAYEVKYRIYDGNATASTIEYKSRRVQNKNAVVIRGLQYYTKYVFKVQLTNSAGSKETGDYTVQTSEGVPGRIPPGTFVATYSNETTIGLEWAEPHEINGALLGYEVSYRGQSSSDPSSVPQNDSGHLQIFENVRQLMLKSLHPGTTYNIAIKARTVMGYGPGTEITASTGIAAPTMPKYPAPSSDDDAVTTETTIEITIIPADSNGAPITNYYVIIEDATPKPENDAASTKVKSRRTPDTRRGKGRKKNNKNRSKRSDAMLFNLPSRKRRQAVVDAADEQSNACYNTPITYEDAVNTNQSAYAGARFAPDELNKETKFIVGRGSSNNGFSNPALDPNKDYNIYVRAESTLNGETKVSCVLVARKAKYVPTTQVVTTTIKTIKPIVDGDDENNAGDKDVSTSTNVPGEKDKSEQEQIMLYASVGGAVVGILVITIVVIIIVIKVRRRKKLIRKDEVVNPFEVRMMITDMSSPSHTLLAGNQTGSTDRQALMPDVVGYEHQDFMEKASENGAGYASASNDERFAVRVDDFHVHVSQMKATGGYGFREEFATFPDGANAPWTVANSPQNRGKNRYGNIMAYDHSRVILDPAPGHDEEFESDYINASYINGYKMPSMYIATQAPSADTSNDFWWMVWQEKTNVIVMVTNLVELGKRKSHKYWPDDRETYGTMQVSLSNEEHMADYVVRSFVIQQADGYDVREVKQFHFTAWPDHGVPSRPTNLLAYIRRIKAYEPQGQGPTLIHCSAGSGRTGCFIVIDMMLDMARDEEIVDIHNTVKDLRSRRVNMVQTEEQYVFIHEAVLEALLCGETSVAADMLVQHYDDLITVDPQTHFAPIQEEFETLNVITPKLSDEECSVARLPRNRGSNRFMDVLPADRHLAYLVTPDPADRENNYINAVYVDSYTMKNSFLVTQMPLPSTVIDIWRLIYDHNCTSIVMMNDSSEHDQTCSQYWPESGTAIFGPFTVELLTKDDEVDVVTRLFKLQNVTRPDEQYRVVQQFQLTNWPAAQPVPFSRNAVLRVIQLVTKWQDECVRNGDAGRTLVHCVAGAGRSGTFVSCYNMCEQLRHEYSVDVFNIVQRLRNVRPQLVETLEQYRFCYEVGIEFADQ